MNTHFRIILRDFAQVGLCTVMATTAGLASFTPYVSAQESGDRLPVCGTIENINVDGRIISREITENCENRDADLLPDYNQYDDPINSVEPSGNSSLGVVVGGLLIAGLAAAAGGGGDNASSPNTSDDPHSEPDMNPDPDPNPGSDVDIPPLQIPTDPDLIRLPDPTPDPEVPSPEPEVPITPPVVTPPPVTPPVVMPPVTPPVDPPEPEPEIPDVIEPVIPIPNPTNPASWRTEEFGRQYGLGLIGVEHRYAAGVNGHGTLGAIYDTGIDLTHDDVGRIKTNLSYSYDDVDTTDISDQDGHGTLVYGIAGATHNGVDIHGVAWGAEFMILKLEENQIFENFGDALKRATDAGADAINNSWASSIRTGQLSPQAILFRLGPDLVAQLRKSTETGISIVFATGNDGRDEPHYLAGLPVVLPELNNLIAVTSLDYTLDIEKAVIWPLSNKCGAAMNWCLAASGTFVRSLKLGNGTKPASGTSLAAPHVTGAILVLKSQFPEMTTPQIHQILFDTAIDLGVPGVDPVFGHGALNLGEAMIPQGALMVELGEQVDQVTVPLATSFMTESPVTGGVLAEALSEAQVLITDAYDRGYFAKLGPRVMTGSSVDSPALQAGLAAAFNRSPHSDLANTGFDLRLDGFGPGHDVTRIAHMDPMMALISRTSETGFSMGIPIGKAILSMANVTSTDASAVSLGASLPFGEGHSLDVFLGRAQETDSILGAKAYGAFAGLESDTVYGRIETKFALSENMILNGSITVGRTSLRSNGIIAAGKLNAQSIALGLTFNNALMYGDQLSLALARPFAVSGGQMTLRGGTGISAAVAGQRTNRISLAETTVLLGKSARAPEVHLGYLHNLKTKRWASADFAFGGVARLDGSAKAAAARVALTFGF